MFLNDGTEKKMPVIICTMAQNLNDNKSVYL